MDSTTSTQKFAIVRALSLFALAYLLVSIIATAISVTYAIVNHSPSPEELGVGMLKAPAFVATVPWHVVVMLVVWPLFAGLYFGRRRMLKPQTVALLGVIWLLASMIVDYIAFVATKHPYAFTPHEFYVDYQPWISLIYLAILISPWIWFGGVRLLTRKPA